MDSVDCVVVGAGVVGLAIARALARTGREVVVVEQDSIFGSGVSSRNSEVVHAGIYYDAASLKASCCVRGKAGWRLATVDELHTLQQDGGRQEISLPDSVWSSTIAGSNGYVWDFEEHEAAALNHSQLARVICVRAGS